MIPYLQYNDRAVVLIRVWAFDCFWGVLVHVSRHSGKTTYSTTNSSESSLCRVGLSGKRPTIRSHFLPAATLD